MSTHEERTAFLQTVLDLQKRVNKQIAFEQQVNTYGRSMFSAEAQQSNSQVLCQLLLAQQAIINGLVAEIMRIDDAIDMVEEKFRDS